ncbi:MAG: ABC transporter substrate-binding protein [Betaproteobacteria bacterium]|nr:ABC transporter substrate-binding protein [Betaproteobacteria bacterium]
MNQARRRNFLLASSALLAAQLVQAQQPAKIHRVGYLASSPLPPILPLFEAFKGELRDLGYIEGTNLVIDFRSAEGKPERLAGLADELVRSKVDVIVTGVNATTVAAKRATQTIPIVMTVGTDVVTEGFVASLAKPGGNITGVTWDVGVQVMPKRLEFLKEAMPRVSRIAVLWDSGQDAAGFKRAIEQGGAAVGARLIWLEYQEDLDSLFAAAARERAQALFTGGGARLYRRRKEVVDLAAKYRLPDTHYDSAFAEAGGLMSYAPNLAGLYRRAAAYVDKILRGAKPADLPVEQPVKLELVINLKTAKALGLTIPQAVLLRADRVIE